MVRVRARSGEKHRRRGAAPLENFNGQIHVFTPHFLNEITMVRVVYGVNRNLLIEICPLAPSPQHPSLVNYPLIAPQGRNPFFAPS